MAVTTKDPKTDGWVNASEHRTPGITIKPLVNRDGQGRSFEFNIVQFGGGDFFSPRHRHNFDQIRIGLEGETSYGEKHLIRARTVGYFPEGAWYGPLQVNQPSVQAILQFDGASHCGYVSYEHLDRATAELRTEGTFAGGFFEPANGDSRIDAYQASWERVTGQSMVYPERRFTTPIYMNIDAFAWVGAAGSVRRKTLGVFGERQTTISMLEVPAGAQAQISEPGRTVVGFVLTGAVDCDGSALGAWSAVRTEETDQVSVTGAAPVSEVILLHLPTFE
ncbi:hypothetical protein [Acrocarpospora catenulata]|uniref:hypothetical protein n=1 Tax=Acrocarpospora catenulata TaxID=2836182 RepID=UPI001BDAB53A|nr:hypothetical protein [Acrocarpospora catenulata]